MKTVMLILLSGLPAVASAQWPPDSFTNLRVLPNDIPQQQLIELMGGFTRALGVRCTYCHVGTEGQPLATYQFALDEKPTKRKAREMLRMVQAINETHLAALPSRAEPPIRVQCATCHRGITQPRPLQDVLIVSYNAGGLDSTLTAYRELRKRYYGSASYDFGEVPLADVAQRVWDGGAQAHAVAIHALNVEMNPNSGFAKRQHTTAALTVAFQQSDDAGTALYRRLRESYGIGIFPEGLMNQLGYRLIESGHVNRAIVVFTLNVEAYPSSGNVYDSLGEAYARSGDKQAAIQNYEKSLQLNPQNTNAKARLLELKR